MAITVNSETTDNESLSGEESAVLEYLERNPGASYIKIVQDLDRGITQDYGVKEIIHGLESLRRREGVVDRHTEGRREYFELCERGEELLEP